MTEATTPTHRNSRQLPILGIVGALIVSSPEMIQGNGIDAFLEGALALAIVSTTLLIVAIVKARRNYFSVLTMLAIYCVLIWEFHKISADVRTTGRWFVEAKEYKSQFLSLPAPPPGELQHIEWESWGFAGSGDTTVFLVFDPNDTLSAAAKNRRPGQFPGLPCNVDRVRRLEKDWYTVRFYTDTYWGYCGETTR